jgi:DNA-binding transcriptional LysR family regulator
MRSLVHEGTIDVAFVLDEFSSPGGDGDERLGQEAVWLLAAPDHPLALRQTPIVPADIASEDLLLTERACTYRSILDRALNRAGIYPNTLMEFSNMEAIKQCVMTGLGLTVLPAVAVTPEIAQGKLVQLPWCGPDLNVSSHVIWHKDKWLSPALSAFLKMTRDMLKTHEVISSNPATSRPANVAEG